MVSLRESIRAEVEGRMRQANSLEALAHQQAIAAERAQAIIAQLVAEKDATEEEKERMRSVATSRMELCTIIVHGVFCSTCIGLQIHYTAQFLVNTDYRYTILPGFLKLTICGKNPHITSFSYVPLGFPGKPGNKRK